MKRFVILFLCLIPGVLAAEEDLHRIWVQAGAAHTRFSDPTVSPLNYFGAVGTLGFDYRYEEAVWGCDAGLEFLGGRIWNGREYEYTVDTSYGGRVYTGVWGRLVSEDLTFSAALGGRIEYELLASFLTHISMYDWTGDLSLSPLVRLEWRPEGRGDRLFWELSMPLFSVLNRPAWTVYDNEIDRLVSKGMGNLIFRGTPVSVDKYLKIRTSLGYDWNLGSGFGITTAAGVLYRHTELPRPGDFIDLSFSLGATYDF